MIPIMLAEKGGHRVLKLAVEDKVRKHLENLGIMQGMDIDIISNGNGVIILKVKEGRVAINRDLAGKIFVD